MCLKNTQTIKFIWLILSTIGQNGDIVLDIYAEILLFWYSVATRCKCGGKYDTNLVTNSLRSTTVKKLRKFGQHLSKLWTNIKWHVFMAHGVEVGTADSIVEFRRRLEQRDRPLLLKARLLASFFLSS